METASATHGGTGHEPQLTRPRRRDVDVPNWNRLGPARGCSSSYSPHGHDVDPRDTSALQGPKPSVQEHWQLCRLHIVLRTSHLVPHSHEYSYECEQQLSAPGQRLHTRSLKAKEKKSRKKMTQAGGQCQVQMQLQMHITRCRTTGHEARHVLTGRARALALLVCVETAMSLSAKWIAPRDP